MIKINLLPHAKRAKTSDTEKQIILFALLAGIIMTGIIAAGIWSKGKVSRLKETVQEKQVHRQVLLSRVGRMNRLQKDFEEIQSNIWAIREIRLLQQLPVRYVDEVVRHLPADKIWFENLNLCRDGLLDIRGVALDNQAFAGFIDEIRASPYVRTVSTQRTLSRQIQGLDLVEFQFLVRAGPVIARQDDAIHED